MARARRIAYSARLCGNLGRRPGPQHTGQNRGGKNDGKDENNMCRALLGRCT